MSFSFGSKSEKKSASSTTRPWEPTIPYLTGVLNEASTAHTANPAGPTPDQLAAINALKAKAGNPYAGALDTVARDTFATTSRAPQVQGADADIQRRLAGYANGDNLDVANNPQLQALLKTVGDDVQWRTNSTFAGAGRDMSGINQQAVARGVTQAQAPLLLDQFNRAQQDQINASQILRTSGGDAATTSQALDRDALATRQGGAAAGDAAIAARDNRENTILALEEQLKTMPFEDLSRYLSMLLPVAGLGQQQTGTSKGTTTSIGAGIKL